MKKLGAGWQYTAYDLGNGRVLKKYNAWPTSFRIIVRDLSSRLFNPELFLSELRKFPKIPQYITNLRIKAQDSIEALNRLSLPCAWFANPRFLDGLDYEQDKVAPLHSLFEQQPIEASKHAIDCFVAFNQRLLAHGIADKFFNCPYNFGVNTEGDVVLMDIGELITDTERIRRQIESRCWAVGYPSKFIQNKELRAYFNEQMRIIERYFDIQKIPS